MENQNNTKTVRRKVRKDLIRGEYYGGIRAAFDMFSLAGKEVDVFNSKLRGWSFEVVGSDCNWTEEMFDPLESAKPAPVLTEWQEKEIRRVLNDLMVSDHNSDIFIDDLKQILSEPEPPKYIPKQGEGVLVKSNHTNPWHPRVFAEMNGSRYQCYALIDTDKCNWDYCRPFDIDLIGTTDNP